MTEPPALPPESRYGRRTSAATRRRVAIALGVLVLAAGVGLAVLGYQRFAGNDVEGSIGAYRVLDDQTVSVTISVTRKDPSRPASCIVRARSRDGAETGRREVLIPPSESKTVQVTTTVASYKRPFVGDIYGCGMNVPDYLVGS
ncbi:MAG TPA: DUF4307 domain-containing protein [Mycobacterium sp.]|jgi:hypothetical protein|nr:DUF4307 domain-containing protein [Mycobacterium sp.]HNA52009.1 DUF4307 domain-containing protein [Mycobacterium sp.]HNF04166.1 DUF4307 domain-containing protein [Mycobacterium sp.]HNM12752.1 DUF4307 domain-containing protein [Mycobacterium sp.]HNM92537.1 DUF4307 domain-containing protein [Mycobacterium sp.]